MCHWHQAHTDCLLEFLQECWNQPVAGDRPRFVCQGCECKQQIKSETVTQVLATAKGDLAVQHYQYRTKFVLVSELTPSQELAFCPTLKCGVFLVTEKDSSIAICPKCKKDFCPHCCLRSHFNRPCVSLTYPLPRDRCVYCKQRQAVKEGCSRVVCYSDFCQGERAYCAVCLVGLPLEQESCRQCHPLNAEPLVESRRPKAVLPSVDIPATPKKSRKYIIKCPDFSASRKHIPKPMRLKHLTPLCFEETKSPPSP